MTEFENVLKFLLKKNADNPDNSSSITVDEVKELGLSELEIRRSLAILKTEGYIKVTHDFPQYEPELDFYGYCKVEITATGYKYFDNKKEKANEKRTRWIQYGISAIVSIVVAIITSNINIILISQ